MVSTQAPQYPIQRRFARRDLTCRIGCFLDADFFFAGGVQISEGGILISTEHNLSLGEHMELHFMLPGGGLVTTRGEVLYKIKNRESSGNYFGLKFSRLNEIHRALISSFVTP